MLQHLVEDPRNHRPGHHSQHTLCTSVFHISGTTLLAAKESFCYSELLLSQKSNSWKAAAGQWQIQTRSNSLLFMQPKDQLHRRKFQWHSFNVLLMLRSQRPHCLSGVSKKHAKHSHDPKYTPCNVCRVKHYAWTSWLGFCLYWCHGKDKQDLLIQNCYTGCCGTET